jgi:hypothetical protein
MSRLFSTANGRRPLAPAFISRIDKWLLLNYPTIWATRIHLFLWYALIGYVIIIGTFYILPDDPRDSSNIEVRTVITALLAAMGIILWLIFLLRFNTFKRFGKQGVFTMSLQLLIFFVTFAIAAFTIFIPSTIEKIKADSTFPNNQLIDAVNQLNYGINLLEKDTNPIALINDTVLFRATEDDASYYNEHLNTYTVITNYDTVKTSGKVDTTYTQIYPWYYSRNIRWEDISRKSILISMHDSVSMLGDTGIVIHRIENFPGIYTLDIVNGLNERIHSPFEIWKLVYAKKAVSLSKAYASTDSVIKYLTGMDLNTLRIHRTDIEFHYNSSYAINVDHFITVAKFKLGYIAKCVENIEQRKCRFSRYNFLRDNLIAVFYLSLVLSILLTIFRYTPLITFAVSALSGIVLSIVVGVTFALCNISEYLAFLTVILLIGTLCIASISVINSRKRSLALGVILRLSLISISFLPIIITALHYSYVNHYYPRHMEVYSFYYEKEFYYYSLTQIGGLILLFLSLIFYHGRLFKIWYAQPEE